MDPLPPTFVPGFHDADTVKQMRYQRLGHTDLIVSRLSFGCSGVSHGVSFDKDEETGDPVIRVSDPQLEKNVNLIESAVKSGINYFDTSPFYGAGKSELVLGHALSRLPRSSFYVATKVGRNENCSFSYGKQEVRRLVGKSLKKLKVNYIDLLQVHDVEFADMDVLMKETLPAMHELKKEGLIRNIGITGYPVSLLREVVERAANYDIKIDCVLSYCRHTLFNNDLLSYSDFFRKEKGMGLINAAVHGMGLLTGQPSLPDWHPATHEIRAACQKALQVCQTEGVSLSKITMAYALESQHVDTVLTGMTDETVLEANLQVLREGLSEKEQQVLDKVRNEIMDGITGHWEGIELQVYKSDGKTFCEKLRRSHGEA